MTGFRIRRRAEASQVLGGAALRRWVGLDIGSQSIKLAELEQQRDGVRLTRHLVQELPASQDDRGGVPAAGFQGPPTGRQVAEELGLSKPGRQLVEWLQSALQEFSAGEVHVSIGGPHVVVRRLFMPLMSKEELLEALKWQIKDQVPYAVQEAILTVRVIRETWDKDIKKQDVLVAAASRLAVKDLVSMVERAGVRVASLTPTSLALWRCVAALAPEAREGAVAVMEVGASETTVLLAKDGHICLTRTIPVGSLTLTNALVGVVTCEERDITIDHSMAEALKRRYGLLSEAAEGTTEEGVPLFHLASLMRPAVESLVSELRRLLTFYRVELDEAGISRLFVCGGGAHVKQLQAFLANSLGVAVDIWNPLARLPGGSRNLEPEQMVDGGPRLAVALGLGLDHGEGLNLLSVEEPAAPKASIVSRSPWVAAGTGVAALALAGYLGLVWHSGSLQRRIQGEEIQWARLEPTVQHSVAVTTAAKATASAMDQLQRFSDRSHAQPLWEGLFKELSALIPPEVECDELAVTADEEEPEVLHHIRVRGRKAPEGREKGEDISRFIERLEDSVFFAGMDLKSSALYSDPRSQSRFEIEGRLE